MDIVNRLKFFMDTNNIAISQFADNCRIPRPTISQILNGRNKRVSDELISKIHNAYPDLSVLWLLFGEGEMVHNKNIALTEPQNGVFSASDGSSDANTQEDTPDLNVGLFARGNGPENFEPQNPTTFTPAAASLPGANSSEAKKSNQGYGGEASADGEFSASYPDDDADPKTSAGNNSNTHDTFIDFGSTRTANPGRPLPEMSFGQTPDNSAATAAQNTNGLFAPTAAPDTAAKSNSAVDAPAKPTATDAGAKPTPARGDASTNTSPTGSATSSHVDGQAHEAVRQISLQTIGNKSITNIVVFYSDNSFQSFYPSH